MSDNASPPPTHGAGSTGNGPGPPAPDEVRDRLGSIIDPVLGKDVVSLGLIGRVEVTDRMIMIEVALFAPYAPSERRIVERIHETFAGNGRVVVTAIDPERTVPVDGTDPGDCATIEGVRNVVAVDGSAAYERHPEATIEVAIELSRLGADVGVFVLRGAADHGGPDVAEKARETLGSDRRTAGVHGVTGRPIDPPTVRGVRVASGDDLRDASESITWGNIDYLLVDVTATDAPERRAALDRLSGAPGLVTATATSPTSIVQGSHDAFHERGVASLGTLELEDMATAPADSNAGRSAERRGIVRPVGLRTGAADVRTGGASAATIADSVGAVRRRAACLPATAR